MRLLDLINSPNIAQNLDQETLDNLGRKVTEDFEADLATRSEREEKLTKAMELALQVAEEKTFPWPQASNVKFPLVTIAALQYHSRAYPALISPTNLVKCKVIGEDPVGEKTSRAKRIETHMTYQCMEEDDSWEEFMDKCLLVQPIAGSVFKKIYFDPVAGINKSDIVFPKDFVISYFTKSLADSRRYTHIIPLSRNDIVERERRGIYLTLGLTPPGQSTLSLAQTTQDKSQGLTQQQFSDTPYEMLEQHRWLDLDEDGYEEPYIVTVRRDTSQVVRIVARYFESSIEYTNSPQIRILEQEARRLEVEKVDTTPIKKQIEQLKKLNKVVRITPETYFIKYGFIPSPDGGFYDIGFGDLLGPLNHSIDTIINQLIDNGTLNNLGAGFLGKGVKIRGGQTGFAPGEWKTTQSTGDDLRKNVFPLPINQPSPVLFQLLQLLINYGERIGMATDIMVGENPGQNTPAETTRHMVEQGQKIYSGVFKRTYRSLKSEFQCLYRLNQLYLSDQKEYIDLTTGKGAKILPQDYSGNPTDVRPAADPQVTSDAQRVQQALLVKQEAKTTPGYNIYEVEKRFLSALNMDSIETIYPDPKGPNAVPPPVNPKIQVEQIKEQGRQQAHKIKFQETIIKLQAEVELNQAKILELQTQALKNLAEAKGVETGHQIAIIEAEIGARKLQSEHTLNTIKILQEALRDDSERGMGSMATESRHETATQVH